MVEKKMWAVGYQENLPTDNPNSLFDFETTIEEPVGHDLLVEIAAAAVNPVDILTRKRTSESLNQPRILGYDAVGTVVSVGESVTLFKPGDQVFYAGSYIRQGSYAEYQLVDERIVAHAPKQIPLADAVAMPLTSLTAYEALFEKMHLNFVDQKFNQQKTLLIINGAGGVGSVAIQLAKAAGLKVIATASRPETIAWVKKIGADEVIDHHQPLQEQIHEFGVFYVDYVLELHHLTDHWSEFPELVAPGGHIVSITGAGEPLTFDEFKNKAISFSWEWMFSKSFYQTADLQTQHEYLEKIVQLLDQGTIKTTRTQTLTGINAENIRQAHEMLESNQMIGKLVILKE